MASVQMSSDLVSAENLLLTKKERRNMRTLRWGIFSLFCTVCLVKTSVAVTAYEGTPVTFWVTYPPGYESHVKYLGRSGGYFEKLIESSEPNTWTRRGRFALFDNTSALALTATIFDPTLEDSGYFTLGVDVKMQIDPTAEIELAVRKAELQRTTKPPQGLSTPETGAAAQVVHDGVELMQDTEISPNISTQNWTRTRNQDSRLWLVLVCVSVLLLLCSFTVFKLITWVSANRMSGSESYQSRKTSPCVAEVYVKMNPIVPPNSALGAGSALEDFYMNITSEAEQIYTEMKPDVLHQSVHQATDQ
ncbi:hypothetical protein DNTS_031447 [Danionella cerebrum]|uniref:Immunoglobulin V-set domain-containing protein n=1 Tax=Danionella cerebrum TaxID=2873325 RepID=A0A553QQ76_9TELE|nr:hypothetical protein DNTS_031447 [Danionella translucida]